MPVNGHIKSKPNDSNDINDFNIGCCLYGNIMCIVGFKDIEYDEKEKILK